MRKLYKRVDIYYLNFHSHIEQLNSSWMDHLENWSDKTYCCSFSDMGGILICMSKIFHLPMLFHFWSMSQSRYHKVDITKQMSQICYFIGQMFCQGSYLTNWNIFLHPCVQSMASYHCFTMAISKRICLENLSQLTKNSSFFLM